MGDFSVLITTDEQGVAVYETDTGRRVRSLAARRGAVRCAALSANRKVFAALGEDLTGLIWNGREIWPPMMGSDSVD